MNTNKSKEFLIMYINHIKNNTDYKFIIENILDFANDDSKVYLKSKNGVSILKIVNKDNSIFLLEAYPNIYNIQKADLNIINENGKSKSIINFKLCYENNNKYFVNRISIYTDNVMANDIIEMFKNDELFYKLLFDNEKESLKELVINDEEITIKSLNKSDSNYIKFVNENGEYKKFKSNKKEFINSKNILFDSSINVLRKS